MRTKTFFLAAPLFPFTTAFAQPAGNHSNSSLCVKWVSEAIALQMRATPPPELAALGGRLMNCSWFVADNSEMLHDFISATPDVITLSRPETRAMTSTMSLLRTIRRCGPTHT